VEDGLGLVVSRMPKRDDLGFPLSGDTDKPFIPGAAGVGFEVIGPGWRPVTVIKQQTQRRSQVGDEVGIGVGNRAANAVVQVGDRESQPEFVGARAQQA
jgi:hypothetical protein